VIVVARLSFGGLNKSYTDYRGIRRLKPSQSCSIQKKDVNSCRDLPGYEAIDNADSDVIRVLRRSPLQVELENDSGNSQNPSSDQQDAWEDCTETQ